MPPRRPAIRSILVAALLPLAAHAALDGGGGEPAEKKPDPTERVAHLPEANPYRAVAMRWLSLPEEDRQAVSAWIEPDPSAKAPASPLSPELTQIARSIAADLAAAANIGAPASSLWPHKVDPKDPDNPVNIIIPDVGVMRELARVATKVADTSPAAEAIPLYAATARFGRELRAGSTLIQGLTGIAVEGIASAGPARRLAEFSPQELEQLSAAWRELPEPAGIEHALHAERNLFFVPIIERTILPGLLALHAEGVDKFPAKRDASASAENPPALDHLRLSGLIEADGEQRIHLENVVTGHVFAVTDKKPAEGVELIRLESQNRRAWMRVNGVPAVLNLQSKRFVSARADIERLRKFLGEELVGSPLEKTPAWVRSALAHPDGPEGYVVDMIEEYDRRMASQIAGAQQAKRPAAAPAADGAYPLVDMLMPTISQVARTMNASALQPIMLEAAIRHRLGQTDRVPADPWRKIAASPDETATPAPFTIESSPDGGLVLRSAYETRSGDSYTYKFGTPDAGVQRKPTAK